MELQFQDYTVNSIGNVIYRGCVVGNVRASGQKALARIWSDQTLSDVSKRDKAREIIEAHCRRSIERLDRIVPA
jgi:hypothetical protein